MATMSPAAKPRPRIYFGYYLVGIALVCQFVTAGAQAYVSGNVVLIQRQQGPWSIDRSMASMPQPPCAETPAWRSTSPNCAKPMGDRPSNG